MRRRFAVLLVIVTVHVGASVVLLDIYGKADDERTGDAAWRVLQILDWPLSLLYFPIASWLIPTIGTIYWIGLCAAAFWLYDRWRGVSVLPEAEQRIRDEVCTSEPEAERDDEEALIRVRKHRFWYLLGGSAFVIATIAGVALQPWKQIIGARENWVSISGRVIEHKVIDDANDQIYHARVYYTFVVEGQMFGGIEHPPKQETFGSRRGASAHMERNHPVGNEIVVYYDPQYPRSNGLSRRDDDYLALSFVPLVTAAYAWFLLARARRGLCSKPPPNARRLAA